MDAPRETRRRAKRLRGRLSLPEGLLWRRIKASQFQGLHFRKQHPLGPYVLDFYCDALKLCIEVDGGFHGTEDRPERDARRDAWLSRQGICTLRISARTVLRDMEATLLMIQAASEPPS